MLLFPTMILATDIPSWNGLWVGEALEESQYYKTPGVFSLRIEQTDSTWSMKECSFKTSYSDKKWGPSTFTIRGNKLYQDTMEVGTIDPDYVHILYEAKGATGIILMEYALERDSANTLHYNETYLMNKKKFYILKGNLDPQSSSSFLNSNFRQEFSTEPNGIPNIITLGSR